MEFYKYTAKKYFDSLCEYGSLRIGTLQNFQSEEHGAMVSDSMEGAKKFSGSYSKLTASMIRESAPINKILSLGDGCEIDNVCLSGNVFIEPNYYIFSMASEYDEATHENWKASEKYDACYKVFAPNTFFRRVTNSINEVNPANFLGVYKVQYYNENEGMDYFDEKNSLPAFMLKNQSKYSEQIEYRAVWQPISSDDIKPINLKINGLKNYCELVAVL